MHQFMTCFSFEEDELLASWILRLSKGNALSPAQFINSYVVDIPKYSGYRITTDYRLPFERFYRSLPIRADEVNLFLSTSTFCGTAPFMPTEQRQKYLNCAFNLNDSLSPLFPQPHGTAATFSVCPVCAETELNQLGHWYLHRAHHLPGVKVCHKHGCLLRPISTMVDRINLESAPQPENSGNPDQSSDLAVMRDYAIFAKQFMDCGFECSIQDLCRLVKVRSSEDCTFDDVIKGFANSNYAALFSGEILKSNLFLTKRKNQYPIAKNMLLVLMYLFEGDISRLHDYYYKIDHGRQDRQAAFLDCIARNGYRLDSSYRDDIVRLRHDDCGKTFCVSPAGFMAGWSCTHCDRAAGLSADDKFRQLLFHIENGEYEAREPFVSIDSAISVLHTKCGRIIKRKPRAMLYEGVRCDCLRQYSMEEIRKEVARFEGFELLKYEGMDSPMRIGHSCGENFTCYPAKFFADPRCRKCQRKGLAVRTTEDFKADLLELVGDEYTLIGDYNGPHEYLVLRHNICGKESRFRPYYFFDGGRCRRCTKRMTRSELQRYVKDVTYGRYEVEDDYEFLADRPSPKCTVLNTVTGEEIKITPAKLLQELRRPAPSVLFPLQKKNPSADLLLMRPDRQIEDYIREQYSNDPIFLEDLEEVVLPGVTTDEVYRAIKKLTKEGTLIRIASRIYGLPGKVYSTEAIIHKKYVCRGWQRIGYYRGEDFMYRIGLIPNPPPERHIATNKESAKTPNRKFRFLDEVVHIKGSPIEITADNYLILETIDFLSQYRQLTDLPEAEVLSHISEYWYREAGTAPRYSDFEAVIEGYKTANIRSQMRRIIGALCKIQKSEG